MTLLEVMKSGRPFRRKGITYYISMANNRYRLYDSPTRILELLPDDVMATDWEVKSEPITRWLWSYRSPSGRYYQCSQYMTEEEFKERYPNYKEYSKTGNLLRCEE